MAAVRDTKIRTALRTNQIAGFVTLPSWKIINTNTQSVVKRAREENSRSVGPKDDIFTEKNSKKVKVLHFLVLQPRHRVLALIDNQFSSTF